VIFEDLAGLLDQIADAGGADFQQVGEHVHGADLPLVEEGEQQPCRVVEQRPAADVPGGPPRPATALLAVTLLGLARPSGNGSWPSSSSKTPLRTVASLTPATWATARTPPCPSNRASAASSNRRCRSFR
jgi:hypothetical protein